MRKTVSIAATVFLTLASGSGVVAPLHAQELPPIADIRGNPIPGAVLSLQKVNLGGVGQWILIRGRDRTKPVLLVLHGGPGAALMPWVGLFQPVELEENFIVVHWDQRGAGKSYSAGLTAEDFDVDAYVSDTLELAELLRRRFSQDKIFLTGISWGSALGFLTLQRDSSPFHAFVAVSERVDWERSQRAGFDWVAKQAEAAQDSEALDRIAALDPFDPADPDDIEGKDRLLEQFGGGPRTEGLRQRYLDYAQGGQSPYYTSGEIDNYEIAGALSRKTVLPQAVDYDLFEAFPESDIPVHFVSGANDRQTPVDLVEDYAAELKAPEKSLTIVQDTGHNVIFDAPRAWADTLIRVADETLGAEDS